MKDSMKKELLSHIISTVEDHPTDCDYVNDLHFLAFNEDHYIIGYFNAEQWLAKHDVSAFEAIEIVLGWEEEEMGHVITKANEINAEKIANLFVYILGGELLADFDLEASKDELLKELKDELEA